jgi:hypothetical protein
LISSIFFIYSEEFGVAALAVTSTCILARYLTQRIYPQVPPEGGTDEQRKSAVDNFLLVAGWGLIPGMTAMYACDYLVCRWLLGEVSGVNVPEAASWTVQCLTGAAVAYAGIRFRMRRDKSTPTPP